MKPLNQRQRTVRLLAGGAALLLAVALLGAVQLAADFENWPLYVAGGCSVSLLFLLLWFLLYQQYRFL